MPLNQKPTHPPDDFPDDLIDRLACLIHDSSLTEYARAEYKEQLDIIKIANTLAKANQQHEEDEEIKNDPARFIPPEDLEETGPDPPNVLGVPLVETEEWKECEEHSKHPDLITGVDGTNHQQRVERLANARKLDSNRHITPTELIEQIDKWQHCTKEDFIKEQWMNHRLTQIEDLHTKFLEKKGYFDQTGKYLTLQEVKQQTNVRKKDEIIKLFMYWEASHYGVIGTGKRKDQTVFKFKPIPTST